MAMGYHYAKIGIYNEEDKLESSLIYQVSYRIRRSEVLKNPASIGREDGSTDMYDKFVERFGVGPNYIAQALIGEPDLQKKWNDPTIAIGQEPPPASYCITWRKERIADIERVKLEAIKTKENIKQLKIEKELAAKKEEQEKARLVADKLRKQTEQREKERLAMSQGGVYVLSNISMPGIVKIGYTERSVEERIRELNSHSGVPNPFKCEAIMPCLDAHEIEQKVHGALSQYRVNHNREFFEISPAYATKIIAGVLNTLSES